MSLRDYGLPDSEPVGVPTWSETEHPCPNCGANVCEVKVKVKQELVKGGEGMSSYLGCPACPWASPAVVVSTLTDDGTYRCRVCDRTTTEEALATGVDGDAWQSTTLCSACEGGEV